MARFPLGDSLVNKTIDVTSIVHRGGGKKHSARVHAILSKYVISCRSLSIGSTTRSGEPMDALSEYSLLGNALKTLLCGPRPGAQNTRSKFSKASES